MTQRIRNHSQPFTNLNATTGKIVVEASSASRLCEHTDAIHWHASVLHLDRLLLPQKTRRMLGGLSHFNAATRQVERYSKFEWYLKIFKDIRGLYAKEMKSTLNRLASQNSAIKAAMASTAPLSQFFFQFSKTPVPCASSFLMYPSASWDHKVWLRKSVVQIVKQMIRKKWIEIIQHV